MKRILFIFGFLLIWACNIVFASQREELRDANGRPVRFNTSRRGPVRIDAQPARKSQNRSSLPLEDAETSVEIQKLKEKLKSAIRRIEPQSAPSAPRMPVASEENLSLPTYDTPFTKNANSIKCVDNQSVKLFIKYYTTVGKRYVEKALKGLEKYYPVISKMLKKEGLPIELALLPIIESAYCENALSSSGALGIWQLMPMTAKINGLKINDFVDERMDIIKSTDAAIKFIKHLKATFINWELILAAYNGGGNYLLQQMRRYKSDNFWKFSKKEGFSQETMEYVPRFYAILHIVTNLKKYGFAPIDLKRKPFFEIVKVKGKLYLSKLAKLMDLEAYELKELNPQLLQNLTPPDENNYSMYIPASFSQVFIARKHLLDPIITRVVVKYIHKRIRVGRGDTISAIARRYRVSARKIIALNHIRNPRAISVGMGLLLPIKVKLIERRRIVNHQSPAYRPHSRAAVGGGTPVVRRAATAHRARTTRPVVARRNARHSNQNSRYIRNRRRLLLMLTRKRAESARRARLKRVRYKIKRGDTVTRIAKRFKIPARSVIRANEGSTRLIAGRILTIRYYR